MKDYLSDLLLIVVNFVLRFGHHTEAERVNAEIQKQNTSLSGPATFPHTVHHRPHETVYSL